MDVAAIASDLGMVKSAFDAVRTALGLVRDVQGVLPAGHTKDVAEQSLSLAERQIELAEAQLAKSLGYSLCRCTFPPQIMVAVGHRYEGIGSRRTPVSQCQLCNSTDAPAGEWTKHDGSAVTVPQNPALSEYAKQTRRANARRGPFDPWKGV